MNIIRIISVALMLCSCTLAERHRDIDVLLPDPSAWTDAGIEMPWHQLEWPKQTGEIERLHVPAGTRRVRITVEKGYDVPILARPFGIWSGPGGFSSFRDSGTVELKPFYGQLAELLIDLWATAPRHCRVLSLNFWKENLLKAVALDDQGDIQLQSLDVTQARGSILTGRFPMDTVRMLPTVKADIPDLPVGRWVLRSDPSSWFFHDASRDAVFLLSYPGSYVFLHGSGELLLHVLTDSRGEASWILKERTDGNEQQ